MKSEEETLNHPSFGIIQFSRINGHSSFFGSDIEHNNYIQLTISEGEKCSSLTSERYYSNKILFKARLTSNQFSELITSLNIGSGVPCTIEYNNSVKTEELPNLENRKTFIHRKFKDRLKTFSNNIAIQKEKSKNIINKKTLSKEDQANLLNYLDIITQEINSNIPYFAECFQEVMDEMVLEAKTEIESSILHKITTVGLEKLFNDQNKLLNNHEKE